MDKSVALTIAKRFITLPLDKRKLYLEKMLEEGVSPANLPIPQVRLGFEHIPLSYAQERQWFLWQMDPHSSAYHIPSALRLKGQLDVPAQIARASCREIACQYVYLSVVPVSLKKKTQLINQN